MVVHRQDGSGTTYVWTDYLTKVSEDWQQRAGTGISVIWPVGIAAKGNEGVVQTGRTHALFDWIFRAHICGPKALSYGSVANSSGQFIQANLASVTAAARRRGSNARRFPRLDHRRAGYNSLSDIELHLDAGAFRHSRFGEAR